MLTPEQRQAFVTAVADVLPNVFDSRQLRTWVNAENARTINKSSLSDKPYENAQLIVRLVLSEPTPDSFIIAVPRAIGTLGGFASINELKDQLQNDPSRWRPVQSTLSLSWSVDSDPLTVDDGRPFVDRLGFRQLLPRVDVLDSPKCLLVEGDKGNGKSYLHEFCKSFANVRNGSFYVGHAEIISRSESLHMFATKLARGLRTDKREIPLEHAEPGRNATNLATWIAKCTPKKPVPGLAVIDAAGVPEVSASFRAFIHELVKQVYQNEDAAQRFRVILIGYDQKNLDEVAKVLKDEQNLPEMPELYKKYILEYVGPLEIRKWLEQRHPGKPDYIYEDSLEGIDKHIPASGEQRMPILCHALELISAKLESQTP